MTADTSRYKALFETMDEGFCIIEFLDGPHGPLSDYIHVEANPAYERHAGIADVVGRKVRDMVPDEADGWVELYGGVLKTGEPIHFRRELVATGRHLEISSFRVGAATERQVAVLFQDVTERVRAEESQRRLNETLEARVSAALAEQEEAEAALRQAQKMEAVGQLTGGLAHDFNNLLAGISGAFELIGSKLDQKRHDEIERYLLAGQGAVRRAAALTQRLLAFSRRQTLLPRPLTVNLLLAEFCELVRRTVGPAIAVETDTDPDLWPVLADANQLENALLNLCINARDAMPDGGRLTLGTRNRTVDSKAALDLAVDPGAYVVISVSDTGSGIERSLLHRVFDPFFTTKPIGVGTGLGLSMVYGFARQSDGQVRIESQVGKGTTVRLYLPRHEGAVPEQTLSVAAGPREAEAGASVLVVDDEPSVRLVIGDALSELGYRCVEAEDGPSAVALLQSDARIDLLITDVGLPNGLNGRQIADAGRRARPGLPILFITGYAETAALTPGRVEPGMGMLTKPFLVDDLLRQVGQLLDPG